MILFVFFSLGVGFKNVRCFFFFFFFSSPVCWKTEREREREIFRLDSKWDSDSKSVLSLSWEEILSVLFVCCLFVYLYSNSVQSILLLHAGCYFWQAFFVFVFSSSSLMDGHVSTFIKNIFYGVVAFPSTNKFGPSYPVVLGTKILGLRTRGVRMVMISVSVLSSGIHCLWHCELNLSEAL